MSLIQKIVETVWIILYYNRYKFIHKLWLPLRSLRSFPLVLLNFPSYMYTCEALWLIAWRMIHDVWMKLDEMKVLLFYQYAQGSQGLS